MPLIDAHEIFSQYHMYFLTGSHFARIPKMALLSISLNLEAQYFSQLWTQSGATYSQEIVYLVYIGLKLCLKILHFEIYNFHEIHQISRNPGICRMSQGPMVLFYVIICVSEPQSHHVYSTSIWTEYMMLCK